MKNILKMISPFNSNEDIPVTLFILKKLLAFVLVYFVSMILAEVVVIGVHYIMGYDVLHGEMLPIETMTLMKYYGYAIFTCVAMMYCKFVEKRTLKSMGFNSEVFGYIKGILIGIILLVVAIGIIILTGNITYNGVLQNINYKIIILFFFAFIIQGVMEETMCRGFLMTSLMKKVSTPVAVIISSLAFSLPHYSSLFTGDIVYEIVGAINLMLVSTTFSLLVINGNSIWVACGMHSFWNFLLYNIFGLNLSGSDNNSTAIFNLNTNGENIINGGVYGVEASIITSIVLLVFSLILILRYRKSKVCNSKSML